MPLLKPDAPGIKAVLKDVGLANEGKSSIDELLSAHGLSLESTLSTVSHIMDHGDSDTIRLKAAEDSLRIHGLMKDQTPPPPSVTIVIRDANAPSVNPILIPRATQKVEMIQ